MLLLSALFVLAGGFAHLREWLDTYRDVPADVPGSAMVRVGFPVSAAVSLLLAVALVACAFRASRLTMPVVLTAVAFQAGSLAFLIGSRVGTVFGWTEPAWTDAASEIRAVEIGSLLALTAALLLRPAVVHARVRRR